MTLLGCALLRIIAVTNVHDGRKILNAIKAKLINANLTSKLIYNSRIEIIISCLLQNFHVSWTRVEVRVVDQFAFDMRGSVADVRSSFRSGQ